MAYSHSRLRKTLALIRVFTGALFLFAAAHKISSWEFAKIEFPQLVWEGIHGAAIGFYGDFLGSVVGQHLAGSAALVAFAELFIGIGLVLGLAVRPVALAGMLYSINLLCATWNVPGPNEPMWRYLDNAGKLIVLMFLFVLFGVGHAGETWGLGSLYHHRSHHRGEQPAARVELGSADIPKIESYSRRYPYEDELRPEPDVSTDSDKSA